MEIRLAYPAGQPTLAFAARELARYLEPFDIDAALLPGTAPSPRYLRLCCGAACHEDLPKVADAALDDAYFIDVTGGEGVIAGTNPRSVLMGAYRYLAELGYAWVRPGKSGEVVPEYVDPAVPVRAAEKADSRHRGVCIEGAASYASISDMIDWLPKIGMNAYYFQFMTPHTFYDRWYAHTRNPLLQPDPISPAEVSAMVLAHHEEVRLRGLMLHAVGHGWTCEPFGVAGLGWDAVDPELDPDYRSALALVGGERKLHGNIPLNTNLCFSQERVRSAIVESIARYCKENPTVDYLHFWLGDGKNNQCECEQCAPRLPSDWYVQMLNELSERMDAEDIPTKIVFLVYVDLLWEPQELRLRDPGRFTLMFAPITRTYSKAFCDVDSEPDPVLAPYERNKLVFSKSVKENILRLKRWQQQFSGDGFDYDYHLWCDQARDWSNCATARVLFQDMQSLASIGLNGMVSCQIQRCFFPTGLNMAAMAAGLWSRTVRYDDFADKYLGSCFGRDGGLARGYLEDLSKLWSAPYVRGETETVDQGIAEAFAKIPALVSGFMPVIGSHIASERQAAVRRSWEILRDHALMLLPMSKALAARASGSEAEARAAWADAREMLCAAEWELREAMDAFTQTRVYDMLFAAPEQA